MSKSDDITHDPIKFKSLTKEKLAKLLSIVNSSETTNVRHLLEKELFVQALCSGLLDSNEMDRMPELIGTYFTYLPESNVSIAIAILGTSYYISKRL